jgi:hypothetical protein
VNETYEIQINGGLWLDRGDAHVQELVSAELLLSLFESGVTFAALDIHESSNTYHNIKIRINREV